MPACDGLVSRDVAHTPARGGDAQARAPPGAGAGPQGSPPAGGTATTGPRGVAVRVCVRTDWGDIECTVPSCLSVAALKDRVLSAAGAPAALGHSLWLRFSGEALQDQHALAHYRIVNGTILSLAVRVRGGGVCMSAPAAGAHLQLPPPAGAREPRLGANAERGVAGAPADDADHRRNAAGGLEPSCALEDDLVSVLREWHLTDATDNLVRHGVISMERLRDVSLEEVKELELPFSTAKTFQRLIRHLQSSEVSTPASSVASNGRTVGAAKIEKASATLSESSSIPGPLSRQTSLQGLRPLPLSVKKSIPPLGTLGYDPKGSSVQGNVDHVGSQGNTQKGHNGTGKDPTLGGSPRSGITRDGLKPLPMLSVRGHTDDSKGSIPKGNSVQGNVDHVGSQGNTQKGHNGTGKDPTLGGSPRSGITSDGLKASLQALSVGAPSIEHYAEKSAAGQTSGSSDVLRTNLQALIQKLHSDAKREDDAVVLKKTGRQRRRTVTSQGNSVREMSQLHRLVQGNDGDAIDTLHSSLTQADWELALCSRDSCDLTPLALAIQCAHVKVVSQLLAKGAARFIFVCGFMPGEFVCTLPLSRAVPESHISQPGREIAAKKAKMFEDSDQHWRKSDELRNILDSALANHLKQLAAGVADFPSAHSAVNSDLQDPSGSRNEQIQLGDIVRLSSGVRRSSVLVSQRGTDNTSASEACLGSDDLNRLAVVIHASEKTIIVSSLSSGHVCEYAHSDLVFADGSSFEPVHSSPKITCRNGHIMARLRSANNWKCDVCSHSIKMPSRLRCDTCDYDLCNKCEHQKGGEQSSAGSEDKLAIGDTVTLSAVAAGKKAANSTVTVQTRKVPQVGMTVKATSGKEGAPSGKPTLSFSAGEKLTLTKVQEEKGNWFACGQAFKTLWFPLSSTDWAKRATIATGCCVVTNMNYGHGLQVVRGPGDIFSSMLAYTKVFHTHSCLAR
jgi:hypothetical protein